MDYKLQFFVTCGLPLVGPYILGDYCSNVSIYVFVTRYVHQEVFLTIVSDIKACLQKLTNGGP